MRFRALAALFLVSWIGSSVLSAQDWKGKGRVDGWVKDPNGQPIADAKVELSRAAGGGTSVKTNAKGYWAVLGLIGGNWNVDVSAPGFEPRRVSVAISVANRVAPMHIRLAMARVHQGERDSA